MIYTSYFANLKKFPNVTPISIARYSPHWISCDTYTRLSPTPQILLEYKKGSMSTERYIELYVEQVLAGLDINSVISDLYVISKGNPIALCCYEKSSDFCHRHLVANWINNLDTFNMLNFPISRIVELT